MKCAWPPPPPDPTIESEDVHVWCASLDAPDAEVHRVEPWLSVDEHRRAGGFRFGRDQRRFVVRRAILRALLGRYLDVHPSRIAFAYGTQGKPRLAPSFADCGLHFNLSHSRDLVLYALARDRDVGVDVEWVRPLADAKEIATRYFSPGEITALNGIGPAGRIEAFFNCWTRKEAYLKATGEGLGRPLESFEVSVVPGEAARLLRIVGDPDGVDRWTLCAVTPTVGSVGAVAAAGKRCSLRYWRWESSGP